jgi:hypothetical protein
MKGNWAGVKGVKGFKGFKGPHMEGQESVSSRVVPDRCSTSRTTVQPSSRIARCGALGQEEEEEAQGRGHRPIPSPSLLSSPFLSSPLPFSCFYHQMLLRTITAITVITATIATTATTAMGPTTTFQKANMTLLLVLVPPLPYDWAGRLHCFR